MPLSASAGLTWRLGPSRWLCRGPLPSAGPVSSSIRPGYSCAPPRRTGRAAGRSSPCWPRWRRRERMRRPPTRSICVGATSRRRAATPRPRRPTARWPCASPLATWRAPRSGGVGWLAYLRGDPRGAEQSWTRLADVPGGRAHRLGALYWSGRAREQQGGREAAQPLYQSVLEEAPRSYYGVLADQRLAGVREGASPPGEPAIRLPANPLDAVTGDPAFARVDLLRRLGLTDLAFVELEDVVQRSAGDSVRLYGLTGAYVQEERYHLALRIMRRAFAGLAATGHPAIPRAFWEMLYPFAWRAEVEPGGAARGTRPVPGGGRRARGVELLPSGHLARGRPWPHAAHAGHGAADGAVRGWSFREAISWTSPRPTSSWGRAFSAGSCAIRRSPAGPGRLQRRTAARAAVVAGAAQR